MIRSPRALGGLACAALLLGTLRASADDGAPARTDDGVRAPHQSALFWRRVSEPNITRAEALLESARAWMDIGAQLPGGGWDAVCPTLDGASARMERERWVKRTVAAENAIARLELARHIAPHDAEIVYTLARATSQWERPEQGCAVSRRDAEARELWLAVRTIDPSFAPEDVGNELAIVATRLGDLDAAITEYQAVAALNTHAPRSAMTTHGNLAELLMLRGELRLAVTHYTHAIRYARELDDSMGLALAEFGLASALDRLGEHTEALSVARDAVQHGDDSMRILRSSGVFFVPSYEVHFYEALGHEARADGSHVPLAAARARGSRAESLSSAVERVLATPLSQGELTELADALATWLMTSAATPSEEAIGAETASGRVLAATIERVRAATDERKRRESRAVASIELRTIDDALDTDPTDSLAPEARTRLRIGCLAAAARSWRRYLDEGGRDGRWAEHARAHLARLAERVSTRAPRDVARAPRRAVRSPR